MKVCDAFTGQIQIDGLAINCEEKVLKATFLLRLMVDKLVGFVGWSSPSALSIVGSSSSGDSSIHCVGSKVSPSFSFLHAPLLDFLGNCFAMNSCDNDAHHDKEMVDSDFVERQCLAIRVHYLCSTIYFSLDTLAQHRVMMGQLQDEVEFLKSQLESLQLQLAKREEEHENSLSGGRNGGSTTLSMVQLLELNVLVVPFRVNGKIGNEIGQDPDANA
jgi:hypothetical protein